MTANLDVRRLLEESEALLTGHFQLSSGLHSPNYMQCARLLQWPARAEACGAALGERMRGASPDVVVAPALGGVVIGQETARALAVRALFTERQDGTMTLRRGFSLSKGERVVIVEDVVTTGKSTREVQEVVESLGAEVVAFAAIVNRSGKRNPFDRPFHALLEMDIPTWDPAECPLCREGSVAIKPGSRPKG